MLYCALRVTTTRTGEQLARAANALERPESNGSEGQRDAMQCARERSPSHAQFPLPGVHHPAAAQQSCPLLNQTQRKCKQCTLCVCLRLEVALAERELRAADARLDEELNEQSLEFGAFSGPLLACALGGAEAGTGASARVADGDAGGDG